MAVRQESRRRRDDDEGAGRKSCWRWQHLGVECAGAGGDWREKNHEKCDKESVGENGASSKTAYAYRFEKLGMNNRPHLISVQYTADHLGFSMRVPRP